MVREMDLADVLAQFEYWAEHPAPGDMLQVLAASWGWKPPKPAAAATAPGSRRGQVDAADLKTALGL